MSTRERKGWSNPSFSRQNRSKRTYSSSYPVQSSSQVYRHPVHLAPVSLLLYYCCRPCYCCSLRRIPTIKCIEVCSFSSVLFLYTRISFLFGSNIDYCSLQNSRGGATIDAHCTRPHFRVLLLCTAVLSALSRRRHSVAFDDSSTAVKCKVF